MRILTDQEIGGNKHLKGGDYFKGAAVIKLLSDSGRLVAFARLIAGGMFEDGFPVLVHLLEIDIFPSCANLFLVNLVVSQASSGASVQAGACFAFDSHEKDLAEALIFLSLAFFFDFEIVSGAGRRRLYASHDGWSAVEEESSAAFTEEVQRFWS